MSPVDELLTELSKMSSEDLIAYLRNVRERRYQRPVKKETVRKQKEKTVSGLKKLLAGMTKEQLQQLLGGKGE